MNEQVESLYHTTDSDFLNDLLIPEKLDFILNLVINRRLSEEELKLATDKICQALFLAMDDISSNAGFVAKLMDVQWTLLDNLSPDQDCPNFCLLFDRMLKLIKDQGYTLFFKKVFININKFMKKWGQNPCVAKAIESNRESFERLGCYLLEVGDYESQAAILETMLRLHHKKKSDNIVYKWFPNHPDLQERILNFLPGIFELECRSFLNKINEEVGKVKSFIALNIEIGSYKVQKPSECPLWVDFNADSAEITFYCSDPVLQLNDTESWEIISVKKEHVENAALRIGPVLESQILHIELIIECSQLFLDWPDKFDTVSGKDISIYFDKSLEINSCLTTFFEGKYNGQIIVSSQLEKINELPETSTGSSINNNHQTSKDEVSPSFSDPLPEPMKLSKILQSAMGKETSKPPIFNNTSTVNNFEKFAMNIPKTSNIEMVRKYQKSITSRIKRKLPLIYNRPKEIPANENINLKKPNKQIKIQSSPAHNSVTISSENVSGRRSMPRKAAIVSSYKTHRFFAEMEKEIHGDIFYEGMIVKNPNRLDMYELKDNEKSTHMRWESFLMGRKESNEARIDENFRESSPTSGRRDYTKSHKEPAVESESSKSFGMYSNSEQSEAGILSRKPPPKPKRSFKKKKTEESYNFDLKPVDFDEIEKYELHIERSRTKSEQRNMEKKTRELRKELEEAETSHMTSPELIGDMKNHHHSGRTSNSDILFEKMMASETPSAIEVASTPSFEDEESMDYETSKVNDIKLDKTYEKRPKQRSFLKNIHSEPNLNKVHSDLFDASSNLDQAIKKLTSNYVSTVGEACFNALRDFAKSYQRELAEVIKAIQPSPDQRDDDDILDYVQNIKFHQSLVSAKLDRLEAVVHKFRQEGRNIKGSLELVQKKAAKDFTETIENASRSAIRDLEEKALLILKNNFSRSQEL